MKKEIEIKIEIPKNKKLGLLKKLTQDLKAKSLPIISQKTYGFFTPDGLSIKNGIFPRIRIDNGVATLTVKVKKSQKNDYCRRCWLSNYFACLGYCQVCLYFNSK